MPAPSKGCRTCNKVRKIKCDQTRPICLNCKKSGRECLGYPNEPGQLLFRSENEFASGHRRRDAKTNQESPREGSFTSSNDGASEHSKQSEEQVTPLIPNIVAPTTIGKEVLPHAIDYARMFYNQNLLDRGLDSSWSSVHTILRGIVRGPTRLDPTLDLVLSANALSIFGQKFHQPALVVEADRLYGKGLREAHLSVGNLQRLTDDQFLMSVMFFTNYETRKGFDASISPFDYFKTNASIHQTGAFSILKLRHDCCNQNLPANPLDRAVRRQLLRQCVMQSLYVPDWLEDGAQYGEEGFELELDRCMVHVARLRHNHWRTLRKVIRALQGNPKPMARGDDSLTGKEKAVVDDLLSQCLELEVRLDQIDEELHKSCGYDVVTLPDELTMPPQFESLLYSRRVHHYKSMSDIDNWNHHRALRLICKALIVRAYQVKTSFLGFDCRAEERTTVQALHVLMDDVCNSMPGHFVDVQQAMLTGKVNIIFNGARAMMLSMVLIISVLITGPTMTQRQYIKMVLYLAAKAGENQTLLQFSKW